MSLKTTMIEVTEIASTISGTSAFLKEGDHLVLWDLLYGMMLPSGNDAAFLIADYFGRHIK